MDPDQTSGIFVKRSSKKENSVGGRGENRTKKKPVSGKEEKIKTRGREKEHRGGRQERVIVKMKEGVHRVRRGK